MNNDTANVISISNAFASEIIQETYLSYVNAFVDVSMLALLFYTTVLAIPQEMKYMWLSPKPLSIPNMLYALTRYGSLLDQAFGFSLSFVQQPGSLCNDLANLQNAMFILSYVGIQGLLITRTYSLCRGNRVIAGALVLTFLGALILYISLEIRNSGCSQSLQDVFPEILAENICVILTDLLASCVCVWKVWGIWKLKREMGIQAYNDLASVLLRQTVLRFCFVAAFTFTLTIVNEFGNGVSIKILSNLQHSFSPILLADFALDLRHQNAAAIQSANITLPTIQIQSVARYVHESILVEMGDHEDTNTREGGDDDLLESLDVEFQRVSASS